MCSIVASFDKNTIIELDKINLNRGNFSYSLGYIDPFTYEINIIYKGFETPNFEELLNDPIFDNKYIIRFRQAPTGGLIKNERNIHPACIMPHYLYHNGIIHPTYLKHLEQINNKEFKWDTFAILYDIVHNGLENCLPSLDGSFACIYIENKKSVTLFRNQMSILFIDKNLNISSEYPGEGFNELESNCIYELDLLNKNLIEKSKFKSVEDRYFFM